MPKNRFSLRLGRLMIDLFIIVTPFNLIPVLIGNIAINATANKKTGTQN